MSATHRSLYKILDSLFLDVLPIQDKAIVLELLLSHLRDCGLFHSVKLLSISEEYRNEEEAQFVEGINRDAVVKELKSIFELRPSITKGKDLNGKDQWLKGLSQSLWIVPVFSIMELELVLFLESDSRQDHALIHSFLSQVFYYVSVLFDRITYIEQLLESNEELQSMNARLDTVNQSLNGQLKKEIEQSQSMLKLAEELSLKESQEILTREIAHEVNNPLCILQLDTELCANELQSHPLDSEMLAVYERRYALPIGSVLKSLQESEMVDGNAYFQNLEIDKKSTLDPYKEYVDLYRYLMQVFQSSLFSFYLQSQFMNLNRISSVMETVMRHGVSESYGKTEVNMDLLIKDVLSLLKGIFYKQGIQSSYTNDSPKIVLKGEKIRLYQVFLNILKNSTEAMRDSKKKQLFIHAYLKSESQWAVDIRDTGHGFESVNLKAKVQGSGKDGLHLGVGLQIVSEIISSFGGEIQLSNADNGASVQLLFPLDVES